MKRILAFITVLFCFTCVANGQSLDLPKQEKGDFLMVTVYKEGGLSNDSRIIISGGEKTYKYKDLEGFTENKDVKTIVQVLNKVKDKGYMLRNSNGSGIQGLASQNYLFQKE